jgi:dihydrofolate reductase
VLKPIHIVVACAENRVIGRGGQLPWHIPEDLKFFHAKTAGKTCILGRICFQTWPRATEDGRQPIVITRNRTLANDRVHVTGSFTEALALADALPGEIHVCGGERIYEETLALAGRRPLQLLLTLIHAEVPGDTFFPEWRHLGWRQVARRESQDANYRYTFLTLELP